MGAKMAGITDSLGPILAKFLAIKEAGKAVGKGAMDAVPGLARDNPKSAMGISALMGAAGGYGAADDEDDVRKDEDAEILRRFLNKRPTAGSPLDE